MKTKIKEINGKYYKECNVSLLGTDSADVSITKYYGEEKEILSLNHDLLQKHTNCHLYIVSLGVKEDKCDIEFTESVIASSNKALNVHKLSKEFIEKYISEWNKGNVITKCLVECIKSITTKVEWFQEAPYQCRYEEFNLIINENTIIIKPEKNIWNKDEVYLDMQFYMEYCQRYGYVTPQKWLEEYKHY